MRYSFRWPACFAFAILLAFETWAFSAEVTLVDGTEWTGTISSIDADSISLKLKESEERRKADLFEVDSIKIADQESTTKKKGKDEWSVRLVDGGRLEGKLNSWTKDGLTLMVQGGRDVALTLTIPSAYLVEIWRGGQEDIKTARELNASTDETDVVFAKSKSGNVKAASGRFLGVLDSAVKFQFEKTERSISTDRFVGVIFSGADRAGAETRFHQLFNLEEGGQIPGYLVGGQESGELRIKLLWGGEITALPGFVSTVTCKNGKRTYLSSLTPSRVEQAPFFDRVMHYRLDESLDGGRIQLQDGEHLKGVAVHSRCVLSYDLDGRYESFKCKVGFDQPIGALGRAVIRVLGDEKLMWELLDARGDQDPIELDLSMTGVDTLTLEVDFGAKQDVGDRVVWADAQLMRSNRGGG